VLALDGLPARLSGPWAEEKLYYVGRYLEIVTRSMHKKWPALAFVDLLAGPGLCRLDDGREFEGSPLLALGTRPPFTHVVLVEQAKPLVAALHARVARVSPSAAVSIIEEDCNDATVIERIRAAVPARALTVVFVDMLGLDVPLATLAALTRGQRSMDLLLTFQTSDLRRNVRDSLESDGEGRRVDSFFGCQDWRLLARQPGDLIEPLTQLYERQLGSIGYPHVGRSRDVMKNSRNVEQYRLLLASRNPRGPDFFTKIADISPTGERRFQFET